MNKITAVRKQLDWLSFHQLDNIKFSISVAYQGDVTLTLSIDQLKPEELTNLKRIFGPLKAEISTYTKQLTGEVKLEEDLTIRLNLTDAYTCTDLTADELTEEKWIDLRGKVRRGEVKIQDCKPNSPVRAGE